MSKLALVLDFIFMVCCIVGERKRSKWLSRAEKVVTARVLNLDLL